ncbi:carbon-nitrogen hydrolase [Polyplosphaeria fusca]|uniref:nitrilase n=1 Tax=Polyplosphaeria fusca TaxID=682080 RepID=A0A9P4QMB8_9PLEO|nr:carbon-nitrogen hydrolase [Polyplosphaeria fusca]
MASNIVRVAVTQQEPVWLDLKATVEKTCRLIDEAAANGARLIAFPEVWITGYPAWIWARPVDLELTTKYIKNSPSFSNSDLDPICAAAKRSKIAVVLGLSERVASSSIYISQCIISPAGAIIMKRRKLKPTHMERTVFGDAGVDCLQSVADVEGIGKVGALSCFEHLQPLLKYQTIGQGEQIHVAAWPPVQSFEGEDGLKSDGQMWSIAAEGIQCLSQTYAIESAAFVLHCTSVMSQSGIDTLNASQSPLFKKPGGGYSAVFGPDGQRLTEPIPCDQEGIVYADLPLDGILPVKSFVDIVGHYSRPDLLWLGVDGKEKRCVRAENEVKEAAVVVNGEQV